jgi:hypothetical protein
MDMEMETGDRWPDWAGSKSANTFFHNTITNLEAITGILPHVRVGADSEDHTFLDESVDVRLLCHFY